MTVISTMQPLTQTGAASDRGHALKVGEERKMTAHNAQCQAAGVAFVPLVVETLGGWSQEAVLHISKIGRLVGKRLGHQPRISCEAPFLETLHLLLERKCYLVGSPPSTPLCLGGW